MKTKNSRNTRPMMLLWALPPFAMLSLLIAFIFNTSGVNINLLARNQVLSESTTNFEAFGEITLNGHGAVTFWFDDAWKSQYKNAFVRLEESNIKGTLAVPTKLVGFDDYMNWDEIIQLRVNGWEITSHSRNHDCNPSNQNFNVLNYEIEGSKLDLKSQGIETEIYLPPCGITSKISDSLVIYHYKYQRLIEAGFNDIPVKNPYGIRIQEIGRQTTITDVENWVTTAQNNNKWLVLMFHQVDYDSTIYGTDPNMLDQIISVITNSDIQVVLPSQILEITI